MSGVDKGYEDGQNGVEGRDVHDVNKAGFTRRILELRLKEMKGESPEYLRSNVPDRGSECQGMAGTKEHLLWPSIELGAWHMW